MDSSIFDVRLMSSSAISYLTPAQLGQSLIPFLDELISLIPAEEEGLELRIRAMVNIMVISKLQADHDRSELEMAKSLFSERQDTILTAQPISFGRFSVMNLGHWTIISLSSESEVETAALCSNLSEITENVSIGKHLIFDFSRLQKMDVKLAAYLMGFQGMLNDRGRKMSIAWLPKNAISNAKSAIQDSFSAKFNLYKKGSFLLSKTS